MLVAFSFIADKIRQISMKIRQAVLEDLETINNIYNDAVVNSVATFDIDTRSIDERKQWFENHGLRYPILVAEQDGYIVGWACLTRWSDRRGYVDTAESSCYIKAGYRAQGVGMQLARELLDMARKLEFHTIIAQVTSSNTASLEFCRKLGFEHIGVMKEVGKKFGQLLDVHILQIFLNK
jgi:phosphinothricin acetyltransferase